MFEINSSDASEAFKGAKTSISKVVLEALSEQMKEAVDIVANDITGSDQIQTIDGVDSVYLVSNRDAILKFRVKLGQLVGNFTQKVSSYKRGTHTVSGHDRTYEGQRPWELSDGSWVVTDRIPNEIFRSELSNYLGW